MFAQFFSADEPAPRPRYENYVGSRFILRLSNDIKSVSRRLTMRFRNSSSGAGSARTNVPTALSSRNPGFQNDQEMKTDDSAIVPAGMIGAVIPIKADHSEAHHHHHRYSGASFNRLGCIVFICFMMLTTIIAAAVAPALQAHNNKSAGGTETNQTNLPTTSPTFPTSSQSLAPSLSPTTSSPSSSPTKIKGKGPPAPPPPLIGVDL